LLDNRSKPIRVLLYDASTTLWTYQFVCRWVCSISGTAFSDWSTWILYINPSASWLTVSLNWKRTIAETIDLTSVNWYVAIANYNRSSSSKTNPRNIFVWKLRVARWPLTMIGWLTTNKYQIINEVSLDQYMRWIAESNDSELQEKANSVYLLARMYAMYYQWQKNSHPSVPSWALYDLTDDPRIHQKYVWIWYDWLSKKRQTAHEMLSGHLVLYNSTLPILPYFTCYPGFTWWAERFGWIDTPYLVSKMDPWQCATWVSQWHGAWLSGRGASMLARRWYTARQILEFYFPGVVVKKY
jgi:peptidoglycan hydrolase-like amidase